MLRTIPADFNDFADDGTLLVLADDLDLTPGEEVIASDGEGSRCLATVASVEGHDGVLELDWSTWNRVGAVQLDNKVVINPPRPPKVTIELGSSPYKPRPLSPLERAKSGRPFVPTG